MTHTSNQSSRQVKSTLLSVKWLKYLEIVLTVLIIYVVVQFYYRFGGDVFSKSLTIGQHLKLSLYAVGSMLSELFVPLLFFSGALIYRLVRREGISFFVAIKRDLVLIIPLGIVLWVYGAYGEEPVERKFYAMLFDIQELQSGEKLAQDSKTQELMQAPNLSGLHEKIDALDNQIKDFEKQILKNESPPMKSYLEELHNQRLHYRDEIKVIHFTPIYVILFLLFGLLLGYLIPLPTAALTAILIVIGFTWHLGTSVFETTQGFGNSNTHVYLLGKIGILLILNTILLILALRAFKRSRSGFL